MARVCCIGGAHIDVGLHLGNDPVLGTSNPASPVWGIGGVAANVARVVAALGFDVALVSQVGADAEGGRVVDALRAGGVNTAAIGQSADQPTGLYAAVLDQGGGLVIGAADGAVYEALDSLWAASALRASAGADVVFIEANLPETVIGEIVTGLPDSVILVADPVSQPKASRLAGVLERIDVMFAGPEEVIELTGVSGDTAALAGALHAAGPATAVVSRGPAGVVVADAAGVHRHDAYAAERVADVTGAGDALLGGFIAGLLVGGSIPAVRWGLAAASVVVASDVAVPPGLTRARVEALLS